MTNLEEAILLHQSLTFRPTLIQIVLIHSAALHVRFGIGLGRDAQ